MRRDPTESPWAFPHRFSFGIISVLFTTLLGGCGRLDELLLDPATTPAQWCERRPCHPVGGVVFGETLGTALVFLLALLWVGAGIVFLRDRRGQRSRTWLGIALLLGGIGAAQAGVSYQAIGYTLKCAGREFCLLTNGLEVGYSLTQALSVSAMLTAVAFACARGSAQRALVAYAAVNALVYATLTIVGVTRPDRLLLSFEVLTLFALPGIFLVIIVAGLRYQRMGRAADRALLVAATLLLGVQVAYFGYAAAGLTARFWNGGKGFYFSENDVLHIGMIGWLVYLVSRLRDTLGDDERRSPHVPQGVLPAGSRQ